MARFRALWPWPRLALLGLTCAASVAEAGCASTSPSESFRDVSSAVESRTGHALYWNRDAPEDAKVVAVIDQMLAGELDVEQAVRIALLNNRTLRATYEELAISQADLVQAGLAPNPRFSAGMTTAEGDRLSPNLELGLTWNFLDLLFLPAKTKIAKAERDATKLRVADVVLDVVAEVKRAYFALVAAQQMAEMRTLVAEAAETSAGIAAEQQQAGNLSDLSLATEQSSAEQLVLERERAQAGVVEARERLTQLLGLWGKRTLYRVASRLPEMPREDVPLEHLEATAIAQRLDLDAMRKEREALGRTLGLVKTSRFTPGIDIGADVARLRDGNVAVAPNVSLELPIFDQKQAVVARLEAMLRATDDRLEARAVEVRSGVRAAGQRMQYARATIVRYRTKVIPLRERLVALSQQQYDAMLLGVYQLLVAKESEVSAYREAIEAARDYWIARADLERAVAVRFQEPPQGQSQGQSDAKASKP